MKCSKSSESAKRRKEPNMEVVVEIENKDNMDREGDEKRVNHFHRQVIS